jgi:histone deacetylase complex regulatory component SIN3
MQGKCTVILASLTMLLLLVSTQLSAQQVDCTVKVNYDAVSSTNKDLLRDFASDVRDYVNNYQWGSENIPDKVRCTLDIFVQRVVGENKYTAQVFVGSQRPIYGSAKSSVVLRLMDDAWQFTYIKGRPINHNSYAYNDLTSFLDFYMYLIMGYDSDTFERMSGTPMFQKASDMASLGRGSGDAGWQAATTGYSRLQLINELLSPAYENVRAASWKYHFAGLDSIAFAPEKAYQNILQSIETIGKVRRLADPRNQIIKVFFDTKYMEIADLFVNNPDKTIYAKIGNIDPAHLKTYEEYAQKQ